MTIDYDRRRETRFKLMLQTDGAYAPQSSNAVNFCHGVAVGTRARLRLLKRT